MIVIYAEKPDMGSKIAAALDGIVLPSGQKVSFGSLSANEKAVKSLQYKQGYLDITFMGQPCKVTWGYGHICGLKQAEDYNLDYKKWTNLPVPYFPAQFELKVYEDKLGQFNVIKKLFNTASLIINATDYDREGEVIFGYVYEMSKCKTPFQRAHFTSNTQTGIRDGFKTLKPASAVFPMEQAGRARSIADWVVGSNLTAQTSLKHRGHGVLSVGRVQTPTLNMLVERENAIRGHKSVPFWTIQAIFTTRSGEEYKGLHENGRYEKKTDADNAVKAINGHPGSVVSVTGKRISKDPPFLYSLSALQVDANETYGLTLAETLEAAQYLYEQGLTTYPRTDSRFLTDDMEPKILSVLNSLEKTSDYGKYLTGRPRTINKPLFFDSSKVSSHFAIVPTGSVPKSLTGNNAMVYDLIAKSVIRMIYPAAEAELTKVITEVNGNKFASNGSIITNPGWLAVDGRMNETVLPALKVGDMCDGKYELKEGKTEPPKPYNDSSLVTAMKTAGKNLKETDLRKILNDPSVEGIGREATRAAIVETLIKRGYVTRNKRQLRATDLGISLIAMLPCEELKSPALTARWESRLSGIANGTESYDKFIEDIKAATGRWCGEITALPGTALPGGAATGKGVSGVGVCPVCGQQVCERKWGWGCDGYKTGCKFTINKVILGKTLTGKQISTLLKKGKTSKIDGFVNKSGKSFAAHLKLANGTIEFEFPPKK